MKSILLLLTGDILFAAFALFAGYAIRFQEMPGPDGLQQLKAEHFFLFVPGVLFASYLIELYNISKPASVKERALRVASGLVLSFALLSVVYYAIPQVKLGRGSFLLSLALFGALQFSWHVLMAAVVQSEGLAKKVLVLGTGLVANKIGTLIRGTNHQHVLRGYYSCDHDPCAVPPQEIVGAGAGLTEVVRREKPQKIVVSLSERRGRLPVREIMNCKLNGIEVLDAPSFYEQLTGKLLLEDLRPSWIIFSNGFRVTSGIRLYKRIFDVAAAAAGLVLTVPVLPLIAAAIALDSEGPVFFRQARAGHGELPFELFKFRTMRKNAENGTGAVWAQKDDRRVTRVGKVLRKTRLDELPQLWNVLKGDMSLIGPRPERPEFVETLKKAIPFYSERHCVKPGITGWAQVRYPYGASVQDAIEKLQFDLFYIKNISPLLDLLIVFETVKVMIFGRGGR
jgi:sugar transferase (PEP-CTERM system associated)